MNARSVRDFVMACLSTRRLCNTVEAAASTRSEHVVFTAQRSRP